jgi:hypothetical protein
MLSVEGEQRILDAAPPHLRVAIILLTQTGRWSGTACQLGVLGGSSLCWHDLSLSLSYAAFSSPRTMTASWQGSCAEDILKELKSANCPLLYSRTHIAPPNRRRPSRRPARDRVGIHFAYPKCFSVHANAAKSREKGNELRKESRSGIVR